jgi:cob(I)alamin adenosyltransferase
MLTDMKIYTRTGDAGSTGLFGGPRVSKDDYRIEAYGTVDELNAVVGMVRSSGVSDEIDYQLDQIQHALFSIGAELATPNPEAFDLRIINHSHIEQMEGWIDQHESSLSPLKHFILPGGKPQASSLHLARSICRRAERRVVTLAREDDRKGEDDPLRDTQAGGEKVASPGEGTTPAPISESLIVFLNRLSDYLFVVSRVVNHQANVPEVKWERPTN